MIEVEATWQEGLAFRGRGRKGEVLVGETAHEAGVRPKELVALGLATCSGMDVVSILEKKRQRLDAFRVGVTAEEASQHPKRLLSFVITYELKGEIDPAAAQRAVALSLEKYCGVSATLEAGAEVRARILVNGTEVPADEARQVARAQLVAQSAGEGS